MTAGVVLGVVFAWVLGVCAVGYLRDRRARAFADEAQRLWEWNEACEPEFAAGLRRVAEACQAFGVQIGEALLPATRQMLGALADLARAYNEALGPTPEARWLLFHWPDAPAWVWWLAGDDPDRGKRLARRRAGGEDGRRG